MGTNKEKLNEFFRPVPPPHLSKENVAVWVGWSLKGDREVAREAAAKGLHLDLVAIFLTLRRKTTPNGAKEWFEKEVLIWVDELLSRKQIFRASHILKNIGLNPEAELEKIFYSTSNKELRDYIGQHLEKNEKLSDKNSSLWHLLELILKNNILISKYKLEDTSLKYLDNRDDNCKHEIAAKLFIRTHDLKLLPFLTAESLWRQLIIYNDTKLLKAWININFNTKKDHYISDNLLQIFKFPISSDMLNLLSDKICSPTTNEIILNEFSKFGIFCSADFNNFQNILVRLSACDNIWKMYDIFSKNTSNINVNSFLSLLHNYCMDNKFYNCLSTCLKPFDITAVMELTNSAHLKLINQFQNLVQENFREDLLSSNILRVSDFLSDNIVQFMTDNYDVLLALIIFTNDIQFQDVIDTKSLKINDIELYPALEKNLYSLQLFQKIINKKSVKPMNTLTYYKLLENNLQVDIKELYAFRYRNIPLPNFNDAEIVQKYGYSKQVNYLFYLKQCRPSLAATLVGATEDKQLIVTKATKLAIKNFSDVEITASCISFMEMIDVDSTFLRVTIQAANILSSSCDTDYIIDLFLKVNEDPHKVLHKLESVVVGSINFKDLSNEDVLVDAMQKYEIVCQFCSIHNIKLPEQFLKNCASYNMWLPFLIFAQLKNYPTEQIKSTLQSLKSPNLLEHIIHSVSHDIQIDDHDVLMKERDSRKSFFSRIGLKKTVDSVDGMYSSITSQSSFGSADSSTGSELLEIDIMNTKATLLQTLIRCHNSTDPPRALLQACQLYRYPLLAVLATSYEPDSVITNWLTWLAVSTEMCQTFTNYETVALCSKSVTTLLHGAMMRQYPKTLLQSFEIFIPDCPLRPFLEFLNLCINLNSDIYLLDTKLASFSDALNKSRRNSVLTDTDHELTYLKNKTWLETTALHLLCAMLQYNCKSLNEEISILKLLCDLKISKYFTIDFPNIENLYEILYLVSKSNCNVKFDVSLMLHVAESRKAVVDCINKLLDLNQFEIAVKVAYIEGLPVDIILIKEWQYKYKNRDSNDTQFWEVCNTSLAEHSVTADCVIDFYLDCLKTIHNNLEKYHLLKYAFQWALKFDLSCQYNIEMDMWLAFMHLEEKNKSYEDFNVVTHHLLYKDMLDKLENIVPCKETLTKDNNNYLCKMLIESLNRGNFWLALKLERMFGCKNADMEILKLCFSLAEGILLPFQLNTQQRLLLAKGGNFRKLSYRRTYLSSRISNVSSASHSPATASSFIQGSDGVDAPLQDTLAMLHSLTEKLTYGSQMAYRIFMSYRISVNIEIPYQVFVLHTDYMKMLKDALEDDCMNKLEVIHDFITVFKWTKEEISDFICEEIVQAASAYVKSNIDIFTLWDLNVNENYHLVLQLLQDNCSLLGYKIYTYASAVHKVQITASSESKVKISELALVIELLILAHNCFTTDCNMEGISIILKKCQSVISNLLTLRSWKLIVRLLTGVARYTEMSYVFQILRENDQFEFLLRKGSRNDNALKVALLEYLKKYCPDNRELYKIVALHFTLFSEVAQLWEREAQSVIKNLIEISKMEMQNNKINPDNEPFVLLSNSESTKLCLHKAIENYTHATEFHLQGEKLAKAMRSANQVELLALQVSILNKLPPNGTANCILNVTSLQITGLITNYLSFEQAYILIQAYNFQPDWSSVLFEQCILKQNMNYLCQFMNHLPLSDTLVHDISRKFLSANINKSAELICMKNILEKLSSVHTKYRIASELGFTDLVEDLLSKGQLAYLKDTVWKKGYKS